MRPAGKQRASDDDDSQFECIPEPPLARRVLGDRRYAWVWLLVRAYLSYRWIASAVTLIEQHLTLSIGISGLAVQVIPETARGAGPILWLVIAACQITAGIFLGLGAYTGLSAFVSGILSFNPMSLGPAAADPLAAGLSFLLILVWRVAGWYGLDRWLLFGKDRPEFLRLQP